MIERQLWHSMIISHVQMSKDRVQVLQQDNGMDTYQAFVLLALVPQLP